MKEEGAPTIQLSVPSSYDKQCPISLFVDGHERDLVEGTKVDEVIVRKIEETVVVYYPKTKLQFVVKLSRSTKYGCFLSVKVCMSEDYRPGEQIIGLLGTPDEDESNEWMKADGTTLEESGSRRYKMHLNTAHRIGVFVTRPSLCLFTLGTKALKSSANVV
jgi:hypothetical protein